MRYVLFLQVVYVMLAIGKIVAANGGTLAPIPPPTAGIAVLIVYVPCTVVGFLGRLRVHAVYAALLALITSVGGVWPHIRALYSGDISEYASPDDVIAAIAIDSFGTFVWLISAWTAWTTGKAVED